MWPLPMTRSTLSIAEAVRAFCPAPLFALPPRTGGFPFGVPERLFIAPLTIRLRGRLHLSYPRRTARPFLDQSKPAFFRKYSVYWGRDFLKG